MSDRVPFWIYEDHARGLALLRGRTADEALDALPDGRRTARWSTAGKGYVIPLPLLGDLCAVAEMIGLSYRVKQVVG